MSERGGQEGWPCSLPEGPVFLRIQRGSLGRWWPNSQPINRRRECKYKKDPVFQELTVTWGSRQISKDYSTGVTSDTRHICTWVLPPHSHFLPPRWNGTGETQGSFPEHDV